MKVKEECEKVGLKLNIQNTKIMSSGPITSWQTNGETVETMADFIFWDSEITADGYCSHEIKMLTPWKESYDQPRQHREGNGTPLQYSCLENPMDGGAW